MKNKPPLARIHASHAVHPQNAKSAPQRNRDAGAAWDDAACWNKPTDKEKVTGRPCGESNLTLDVDLVEELVSGNTAVTRKRVHHPTIRRDRERAAEEHCTNNDHLKTPQFRAHTHKSKEGNQP